MPFESIIFVRNKRLPAPHVRVSSFFAKVFLLTLITAAMGASAQGVANAYASSRSTAFTYEAVGLLETETLEPDLANQCLVSTSRYDNFGNKTHVQVANCAGASGSAVFASRDSGVAYPGQASQTLLTDDGPVALSIPLGQFPLNAANALGHSETRTFDPRFGSMVTLLGPNAIQTKSSIDDFGRKTAEVKADGTRLVGRVCLLAAKFTDTSSNDPQCRSDTFAEGEILADAVSYSHQEPRDANNQKIGAFTRTYVDAEGRTIREAIEAFDGAGQPTAWVGRLIVKDTSYNAAGLKIVTTQPYFLKTKGSRLTGSSDYGMTLTRYDALGRASQIDVADAAGAWPNVSFNGTLRTAARTTISFSGLKTTVTNSLGQTREEERGINGQVILVTDNSGAQIFHQYDAWGSLKYTLDPFLNKVEFFYDERGRKVQVNDPDSGTIASSFNALSELVRTENEKQRIAGTQTVFAYDVLGRMVSRTEPEYTSAWRYDECPRGVGRLCSVTTSGTNGLTRNYFYDDKGRSISNKTSIAGGITYAFGSSYDAITGRLDTQTYPTGLQVRLNYSKNGFIESLKLVTGVSVTPIGGGAAFSIPSNATLWTANGANAFGTTESETVHNGIVNRASFDANTGRTTRISAGVGAATNVVEHDYTWDAASRLRRRVDGNGEGASINEDFAYDAVNRLAAYSITGASSRNVGLSYNALGNTVYKSDVGNYDYAGARPHAVKAVVGSGLRRSYEYETNGNMRTATSNKYKSISYTYFNLPDSISDPATSSSTYKYQYDEAHARIRETHVDAAGTRTTWFAHPDNAGGLAFEREFTALSGGGSAESNRHYLSVGGSVIGVLASNGSLPVLGLKSVPDPLVTLAANKLEFWHRDHLGSLVATTNDAGAVTARYAYDPFGKRRFPDGKYDSSGSVVVDWSPTSEHGTDRGFTGHEHLDDVGIIHMNGRLFDPMIGRFLQADPMIQDVTNLQNFDRYGYCFNSPLGCTDPTGHSFLSKLWKAAVAVVKIVAVMMVMYLTMGAGSALSLYLEVSLGMTAASAGIASAAIGGFIAGAIQTGTLRGALQGSAMFVLSGGTGFDLGSIVQNAVAGCVGAVVGGGNCRQGALSHAFSQAFATDIETKNFIPNLLRRAVIGGTAAVLGGGKFKNGAASAAFDYAVGYAIESRALDGVAKGFFQGTDTTALQEYGRPLSEAEQAILLDNGAHAHEFENVRIYVVPKEQWPFGESAMALVTLRELDSIYVNSDERFMSPEVFVDTLVHEFTHLQENRASSFLSSVLELYAGGIFVRMVGAPEILNPVETIAYWRGFQAKLKYCETNDCAEK